MKFESKTLNIHKEGELLYLTFPLFDKHNIKHAFTTRKGGASVGQYASFNTGFQNGDSYEAVYENFRRICSAINIDEKRLVFGKQTHTNNVRCVTDDDIGKGIIKPLDYDNVDGLISNLHGVGLVTQYADCTPLMFCDIKKRVIATSHAGWRGTAAQIGKVTVDKMVEVYGCERENIIAAIGPCIDKCCYEVDNPVYEAFSQIEYLSLGKIFTPKENGKYMLNLKEANKQILINAGIVPQNIDVADLCTCCNHEYLHSHRYTGGVRGNLGLIISL